MQRNCYNIYVNLKELRKKVEESNKLKKKSEDLDAKLRIMRQKSKEFSKNKRKKGKGDTGELEYESFNLCILAYTWM